jgi:maltose O-acetyltransferase
MTEKEKMLQGDYYNSRDTELINIYHKARRLIQDLNQLRSTDLTKREIILTDLLGYKGKNVWIEAPFFCDYGENIYIGENTFVNFNCIFLDDNRITIGKNVLVAPYVQIYTASHPLKATERIKDTQPVRLDEANYFTCSKPVEIGNNVWIGGNTVIMPGVKIGHNTTIGASSLVTRDIPDNVLAYGIPCKVIKDL